MTALPAPSLSLPAQRHDARGRVRVDWRAVLVLATPMIANNAIQAVLNLTDTWFIGHISTQALAAVASVQWLTFVAIMLFGGVGLAVQTIVAQAYGARRLRRASQATWIGLWATFVSVPIFFGVAYAGEWLLAPFHLDKAIETSALEFWRPRLYGAPLAVMTWAILGFFNGIGRPRLPLLISALVALANVALNWLFIIHWHFGVAGSAWATNCAMLLGVGIAIGAFVAPAIHRRYRSRFTWRLRAELLWRQWRLGFPMGLMIAADVVGVALFQLMAVRLSAVDGAVTQIAMMMTSIAFMPAVGISLAGTTLVGQSIGAGDRIWAFKIGNAVILLATVYMTIAGLTLGLAGPWLFPAFVAANDPQAQTVIQLGTSVIWIAGAYQLFDGLNISSGFCLRGAGDTTVPAVLVIALSWLVFVPAAHMMMFAPSAGWSDVLPQLGWGTIGGWTALLAYVVLLGLTMFWRWHARAWQHIAIS